LTRTPAAVPWLEEPETVSSPPVFVRLVAPQNSTPLPAHVEVEPASVSTPPPVLLIDPAKLTPLPEVDLLSPVRLITPDPALTTKKVPVVWIPVPPALAVPTTVRLPLRSFSVVSVHT
jgi:hypothetical protein